MNAKVGKLVQRLCHDQRGLTTVEYTIVLCLIAAMAVVTWQKFGSSVRDYLSASSQKIDGEVKTGLEAGK